VQTYRPNNYVILNGNKYNVISRTTDGKIMELWGTVVPADSLAGYGVGCIFKQRDGGAGTAVYINEGTELLSDFNAGGTLGSISADNVTVEDSGAFTDATNAETALAELYQNLFSATGGCVDLPLNAWKICDADGDVAVIAVASGNGGQLAADSAPILEAVGTTNANRLRWIANGVERITCTVALPADFQDGADAVFQLIGNSAGTSNSWNAAVLVTNWNGGADVVDALTDTANTTVKAAPGTIAHADIPADPLVVTISLTPPAHATDALHMLGARLLYKRKLLTS
jgi:hypothetical protein